MAKQMAPAARWLSRAGWSAEAVDTGKTGVTGLISQAFEKSSQSKPCILGERKLASGCVCQQDVAGWEVEGCGPKVRQRNPTGPLEERMQVSPGREQGWSWLTESCR